MVGYGSSIPAGHGRDISVAKQAEYLLAWLDELGIDRAVLVGHDLGGGVAQIAAVRDPARCAGLVLTNCISRDSWPVPPVRMAARLGGVLTVLPNPTFRWFFLALLRLTHDTPRQASDAAEIHGSAYGEHDAWAAFVRQVRSLRTEDTLSIASQVEKLGVVWESRIGSRPSTTATASPPISVSTSDALRVLGISRQRTTRSRLPEPSTGFSKTWPPRVSADFRAVGLPQPRRLDGGFLSVLRVARSQPVWVLRKRRD